MLLTYYSTPDRWGSARGGSAPTIIRPKASVLQGNPRLTSGRGRDAAAWLSLQAGRGAVAYDRLVSSRVTRWLVLTLAAFLACGGRRIEPVAATPWVRSIQIRPAEGAPGAPDDAFRWLREQDWQRVTEPFDRERAERLRRELQRLCRKQGIDVEVRMEIRPAGPRHVEIVYWTVPRAPAAGGGKDPRP